MTRRAAASLALAVALGQPLARAEDDDDAARAVPQRPLANATAPASPVNAGAGVSSSPPQLAVAFEGRMFPGYGTALTGLRLGVAACLVSLAPSRPRALELRGHLEPGVLLGGVQDPLGQIKVGAATVAVGVGLGGRGEGYALELGPRVEMGGAWASAQAYDAATTRSASVTAFVATASIMGRAALRLQPGWWGTVGLDVGSVVQSLEARSNNQRAAGVGGVAVGLAVGIAGDLGK